jgi:hydroxypyruvate reductase
MHHREGMCALISRSWFGWSYRFLFEVGLGHGKGYDMTGQPQGLLKMRNHARAIFDAAVEAVNPERAVLACLERSGDTLWVGGKQFDLRAYERLVVVGAGKASAAMASAVEKLLADRITRGLVIVKYGYAIPLKLITIHEAGHPIPDKAGLGGAQAIVELLDDCTDHDLVIALISGGGSALLPLPAGGITLSEKQELTEKLLRCGATIHEMNTVRKHISRTKGGGLARAAYPATVINLMLSDVMGGNPDTIGAGPFVPDRSTYSEAAAILERYNLMETSPHSISAYIRQGMKAETSSMPVGDAFEKVTSIIVADNRMACLAAKSKAEELGYAAVLIGCDMGGNTTDVALVHAAIAKEVLASGNPAVAPACIISGGETTVVVKGRGQGGRNQEFALVAAREISQCPGMVVILSGGTDGTDGPTDAAGGMVDNQTTDRGNGLDIDAYLADNDAYHYLETTGDLLMTGPTRTNVMDLRIVLIEKT